MNSQSLTILLISPDEPLLKQEAEWLHLSGLALELRFVVATAVSIPQALSDFPDLPDGLVLLDTALLRDQAETMITAVHHHFPHAPLILLADTDHEFIPAWAQLPAVADVLPRSQFSVSGSNQLLFYIYKNWQESIRQQTAQEQCQVAQALLKTGAYLNAILDYDLLLDSILEQATLFFPFDLAAIMLLEADQVRVERIRVADAAESLQWAIDKAAQALFPLPTTKNLQEIIESGRYLVIPNVDDNPDWIHLSGDFHIRSWVGAPLMVHGKIIGILSFDNTQPNVYRDEDGRILEKFAQQAALALHNAEIYRGRQREIAELSALHAIAQVSIEAETVDALLTRCTRIVAEKLYPDSFGFVLLNEDGVTLSAHHAFHNRLHIQHPEKLPRGTGVVGQVIETGQLRRISDVRSADDYKGIVAHTHSELCVPLRVGGAIIGAINAESILYEAFTLADERFMVALSQQLGAGIERIRLLAAERQNRQEEERLQSAVASLSASLDLEQVFTNILNYLEEVAPHDSAAVMLLRQDVLVIVANRGQHKQADLVGKTVPSSDWFFTEVCRTKRPFYLKDARQYPQFQNWRNYPNTHSWIILPLIVREQVLGVLTVEKEERGAYGPVETRLAHSFANQAAVAIENARLYEAEQKARKRAEIMREASAMMVQTLDMDTILNTLLAYIQKLVPYDSASVLFVEGDFACIHLAKGIEVWGDAEAVKKVRINIKTNETFQEIMRTQQGLLIPDVHYDGRWQIFEPTRYVRSWIGAPIIAAGQFIGYFSVDKAIPGFFTKEHLALIEDFTNQVAIIIQNAQLFQETRQRTLELELISALSAALRETNELEMMLPIVLEKVMSLVNGYFGGIYLIEPETGDLIVRCTQPEIPDLVGQRQSVQEGISGYVARTGQVYIAPDFTTEPFLSILPAEEPLMQVLRTGVNLPLRTPERTVGVLHVNLAYEHVFTDREIQLLTAVSEIAGTAIDRALVLNTLEQRVAERTHELAKANERLTELDRLKTKFVSDVSHELRTPITNLSLYLDLLEQGKAERREQYTAVLRRQVNRLITMIEDILHISRLDMGKIKLHIEPVDVNRVIKQVARDFQEDLNEDLTFSAHYYQDIPLILGDEKQIAQIIINLLNNAANYTEAGSISITTSWNDERNQVRIEIKDTGIGVPSQEIGHLFERFYRGSNVSQSNIPGTGLGLSVVKELVNLHQGEIKIESELNVGATVTLFLPGAPRLSSEQWTVNSGQWTVNSGQ